MQPQNVILDAVLQEAANLESRLDTLRTEPLVLDRLAKESLKYPLEQVELFVPATFVVKLLQEVKRTLTTKEIVSRLPEYYSKNRESRNITGCIAAVLHRLRNSKEIIS